MHRIPVLWEFHKVHHSAEVLTPISLYRAHPVDTWFSFGSAVEHFIISPAQHQIHHSADPRHFNRNFGSEFALWDWIFGTLYIPRRREDLILGLGAEENRRLGSTWEMLINPIRAMRRHAYL
jgi:sterol desaturase/sphingolipid hydroxylase (fatty acid hydroxylase superfamily)